MAGLRSFIPKRDREDVDVFNEAWRARLGLSALRLVVGERDDLRRSPSDIVVTASVAGDAGEASTALNFWGTALVKGERTRHASWAWQCGAVDASATDEIRAALSELDDALGEILVLALVKRHYWQAARAEAEEGDVLRQTLRLQADFNYYLKHGRRRDAPLDRRSYL